MAINGGKWMKDEDEIKQWDKIREAIEEFLELDELRQEIKREEALEWIQETTSEWLH